VKATLAYNHIHGPICLCITQHMPKGLMIHLTGDRILLFNFFVAQHILGQTQIKTHLGNMKLLHFIIYFYSTYLFSVKMIADRLVWASCIVII